MDDLKLEDADFSFGFPLTTKPSIRVTASHGVKPNGSGGKKDLLYIESFNKPEDYLLEITAAVNELAMQKSLATEATPQYVFPLLEENTHSVEHPLIKWGLLSSRKDEQLSGVVHPQRFKIGRENKLSLSVQKSRQQYYRPNSTHQYLAKSITNSEMYAGFDASLGTPTRTMLLRNRMKFSTAPDLTYVYLNSRKPDGTREALVYRKRLKQAETSLKASKIELDKTNNAYRRLLLGTRYTGTSWRDLHNATFSGNSDILQRPRSSCGIIKEEVVKVDERRAASAICHSRDGASIAHENRNRTLRVSKRLRSAKKEILALAKSLAAKGEGDKTGYEVRSKNPVPYSAPINSPRICNQQLAKSITIRQISSKAEQGSTEASSGSLKNIRHQMAARLAQQAADNVRSPWEKPNSLQTKANPPLRLRKHLTHRDDDFSDAHIPVPVKAELVPPGAVFVTEPEDKDTAYDVSDISSVIDETVVVPDEEDKRKVVEGDRKQGDMRRPQIPVYKATHGRHSTQCSGTDISTDLDLNEEEDASHRVTQLSSNAVNDSQESKQLVGTYNSLGENSSPQDQESAVITMPLTNDPFLQDDVHLGNVKVAQDPIISTMI